MSAEVKDNKYAICGYASNAASRVLGDLLENLIQLRHEVNRMCSAKSDLGTSVELGIGVQILKEKSGQ